MLVNWEPGVTKLVEACDRLVDEVASVVPGDASLILDTGCGVGAGTCRVAASFPRAFVLGVNISHGQLLQARRRGVENPVVMDAACLAIAHGVADAVIALSRRNISILGQRSCPRLAACCDQAESSR